MKAIQQELDLFYAATYNDLLVQHNIDDLKISFNKRLHKSWHLTVQPTKEKHLVLPYLLKDAPEDIKTNIIAWTQLKKPRLKKNRPPFYKQKKLLETTVWNYLESQGVTAREKRIKNPQKYDACTKGTVYDLRQVFDVINGDYYRNELKSYVRWGSYASKTSYLSRCIDENKTPFNLITIAGVYNHPKVPAYAIYGVMFHEMLHIAIPPYKKNGRNIMHGPEFKRAEKKYTYLRKWYEWERRELHKILRAMRRQKKRNG